MIDFFMLLVLLALLASPFLPALLRGKCPVCLKRKLEQLETIRAEILKRQTFVTYYVCHNCNTRFQRDKSGPLQIS